MKCTLRAKLSPLLLALALGACGSDDNNDQVNAGALGINNTELQAELQAETEERDNMAMPSMIPATETASTETEITDAQSENQPAERSNLDRAAVEIDNDNDNRNDNTQSEQTASVRTTTSVGEIRSSANARATGTTATAQAGTQITANSATATTNSDNFTELFSQPGVWLIEYESETLFEVNAEVASLLPQAPKLQSRVVTAFEVAQGESGAVSPMLCGQTEVNPTALTAELQQTITANTGVEQCNDSSKATFTNDGTTAIERFECENGYTQLTARRINSLAEAGTVSASFSSSVAGQLTDPGPLCAIDGSASLDLGPNTAQLSALANLPGTNLRRVEIYNLDQSRPEFYHALTITGESQVGATPLRLANKTPATGLIQGTSAEIAYRVTPLGAQLNTAETDKRIGQPGNVQVDVLSPLAFGGQYSFSTTRGESVSGSFRSERPNFDFLESNF